MNLYVVEFKVSTYGQFDSFVVAADNEFDAVNLLHQETFNTEFSIYREYEVEQYQIPWRFWAAPKEEPNVVTVTKIGEADREKPGVILGNNVGG